MANYFTHAFVEHLSDSCICTYVKSFTLHVYLFLYVQAVQQDDNGSDLVNCFWSCS